MRRYLRWILPLTLAALLLGLLAGCGLTESTLEERISRIDRRSISASSHEREEDYPAAFETRVLKTPYFTFEAEKGLFDDEEMRVLARKICTDLYTVETEMGKAPDKVTVYVVASTIGDRPRSAGKSVFCTAEDVRGSDYRPSLLAAGYGLEAEWQEIALADRVFGGGLDDGPLTAYYADPDHALTSSLAAVYFHPETADEETMDAARRTAASLTDYILYKRGFDAFCRDSDPAKYLGEWRERMGLDLPDYPAGSDRAVLMRLESSRNYRCVLRGENLTVNVERDSWAATADEIFRWQCDYYAGMDLVTDRIREELPDFAQEAEKRLEEPLTIYLTDWLTGHSYANLDRREIRLSRPENTWHEAVHILLPMPDAAPDLRWQSEALADHYSLFVASRLTPRDDISRGLDAYRETFREITGTEEGEDDLTFHESVWNVYQALRDPAAETYDDLEAYGRAYGICSLLLSDIHRDQYRVLYDGSVGSKVGEKTGDKSTDGNGLNYSEAMVIAEYLAQQAGWEKVAENYRQAAPLKEAYGMDYPALYEEACAWLRATYGDLLSAG